MTNLTPAQKVEQSLRNYGIWLHFCLGVIFGTFLGQIVISQDNPPIIIGAIIGLVALISYYLITLSSARMLKRSISLVAHPLEETKEPHV